VIYIPFSRHEPRHIRANFGDRLIPQAEIVQQSKAGFGGLFQTPDQETMERVIREGIKELSKIHGIHYCDNIQDKVQQVMWTRFSIVFSYVPDYSEDKVEEWVIPDSLAYIDGTNPRAVFVAQRFAPETLTPRSLVRRRYHGGVRPSALQIAPIDRAIPRLHGEGRL
jgi:hypothetical protein